MASSAFRAQRLTPTTFLVKEYNDIYNEKPHIYVKVVQEESSMKDHGRQSSNTLRRLREFIETIPRMDYIVILTHCHYDHILHVSDWDYHWSSTSSPIVVSGYDPTFLSPSALPEHTLCNTLHIPVPIYTPSLVSNFHDIFSGRTGAPRLTVLHTPEGMLYVGGTLYEDEPIIFSKEGSIVTCLVGYTRERNTERERDGRHESLINAGHCTARKPALEVLTSTVLFMRDVISRKERLRGRREVGGIQVVECKQKSGRYSLRCPERLVDDARRRG
ncbi:hypothetical protein BJ165DRAFT_1413520 [Panaeolus papilionaceus]|nr:hypothetical protein BJ165DRAFT_1413520 [Panaeolus papilionaceus]